MKLSVMADLTHADEVNPNKASASPAELSVRKRSHQTKLSMGYFPTMAASGPSGNDKVPMVSDRSYPANFSYHSQLLNLAYRS